MKFLRTIFPIILLASVFVFSPREAQAECVGNAVFRVNDNVLNGAGQLPIGWFTEANPPYVYVDVSTSGCNDYYVFPFVTAYGYVVDSASDLLFNDLVVQVLDVAVNTPDVFEIPDGTPRFVVDSSTSSPTEQDENLPPDVVNVPFDFTIAYKAGEADGCASDNEPQDCSYSIFLYAHKVGSDEASCLADGGEFFDVDESLYEGQANCLYLLSYSGVHLTFNTYIPEVSSLFAELQSNCGSYGPSTNRFKKIIADYICSPGAVVSLDAVPDEELFAYVGPGNSLKYDCDGLCSWSEPDWKYVTTEDLDYVAPDDIQEVETPGLPEIYEENYSPLAPLPFQGMNGADVTVGGYLTGVFQLLFIVAGVGALVMIIAGGLQILSADSIGSKSAGRAKLKNAVLGLALVLGSYAILNTFNPNLVGNLSIGIPFVKITVDEENFSLTETSSDSDETYNLTGTFDSPSTSPGLTEFLNTIDGSEKITKFVVSTSGSSLTIHRTSGQTVTIPVTGFGGEGIAEVGQGVSGDRKTPKGTFKLCCRKVISKVGNEAVLSRDKKWNLGPAFIGISIDNSDSGYRGIGFHGNASNNPSVTAGCVRLKNDDVLALARKVSLGIDVIIE